MWMAYPRVVPRPSAILLLFAFALLGACDRAPKSAGDDAAPKLLGERLINEHGEGYLTTAVLTVYDSGYIVGDTSVDAEFATKVDRLAVPPASARALAGAPFRLREAYSEEGVAFGVAAQGNLLVVDSTSSLTIRLLFGQSGIRALRMCESVQLDRVCKRDGELRARLDDIDARGGHLIEDGTQVALGEVQRGWLVFREAPDIGDQAELELILGDGVRCNLTRWVIDPRDSCAM